MWDTGVKASDGLILLAEEGGTSVLFDEINSQGIVFLLFNLQVNIQNPQNACILIYKRKHI